MGSIELVIEPREAKISEFLSVRRILPYRARRSVGPFCFLDHMGPHKFSPDQNADVLPHPHIGLATMTYLFSGKLFHRDSLGSQQVIVPGDVNWMTAGKGVVHSERMDKEWLNEKLELHGLQAWVALPKDQEECEPNFTHYPAASLPSFELSGTRVSLAAGAFGHEKSPVQTSSPLFFAKLEFQQSSFEFASMDHEAAFYLVSGTIKIDGKICDTPNLIIFKKGSVVSIESKSTAMGIFFGGKPLPEPRLMDWNFVATNKELLDQARKNWKEQKFPKIPGDTDFVPLPE